MEKCYNGDVIKECLPPLSTQNTSLAVTIAPGRGMKRTFEGQRIGSPAKISREGPSIYSEGRKLAYKIIGHHPGGNSL